MTLRELAETLELKVLAGAPEMGRKVAGGYASDLMSNVMANAEKGDVWITVQIHQNIVAVASLKELAGIIISNGRAPEGDTVEKAEKESVPIMVSGLTSFELAGRIYELLSKKA